MRNWAEKVSLTQIGCKLDANKDREFWADFNTGLIRLGQGHVLGQNILLEWQDPNPIVPIVVRFMTGWGATGLWNVKLGKQYLKDTDIFLWDEGQSSMFMPPVSIKEHAHSFLQDLQARENAELLKMQTRQQFQQEPNQ